MNTIAQDNQLFSIVEDNGFIELMAHLQPQYLQSSRRYLPDTMLPWIYRELKGLTESELAAPTGDCIIHIWYHEMSHIEENLPFTIWTLGEETFQADWCSSSRSSFLMFTYWDKHYWDVSKYVGTLDYPWNSSTSSGSRWGSYCNMNLGGDISWLISLQFTAQFIVFSSLMTTPS